MLADSGVWVAMTSWIYFSCFFFGFDTLICSLILGMILGLLFQFFMYHRMESMLGDNMPFPEICEVLSPIVDNKSLLAADEFL
jgi:hypothetical protein